MSVTIGGLIDQLFDIREQKRKLESQISKLDESKSPLEAQLMELMQTANVTQSRGRKASVTLKQTIVPQVQDWDKFYAYIQRNKAFHMLERRPAAAAYREALELRKGKPVPGVIPFSRNTISLNAVDQEG
jgi:hypothetical protein